jgi:type IV pilus assembly protein PilB
MTKVQKPLGEILTEAGLIDGTHLKAALASQTRWGGRIGEHLVKAGMITEQQLMDALSHQLGVAKVNFRKSHIYLEALRAVPRNVCVKYTVIPIAVKAQQGRKKLLLAMADPTNFQAIQEVEFISGHAVVTALASESDVLRAIDWCYSPDGLRESSGLAELSEAIELTPQLVGTDNEAIIINPEAEFAHRDHRVSDYAFRALVDLLIEKRVFTAEELHTQLEKYRGK